MDFREDIWELNVSNPRFAGQGVVLKDLFRPTSAGQGITLFVSYRLICGPLISVGSLRGAYMQCNLIHSSCLSL